MSNNWRLQYSIVSDRSREGTTIHCTHMYKDMNMAILAVVSSANRNKLHAIDRLSFEKNKKAFGDSCLLLFNRAGLSKHGFGDGDIRPPQWRPPGWQPPQPPKSVVATFGTSCRI
jgi:hypothetical protein